MLKSNLRLIKDRGVNFTDKNLISPVTVSTSRYLYKVNQ